MNKEIVVQVLMVFFINGILYFFKLRSYKKKFYKFNFLEKIK